MAEVWRARDLRLERDVAVKRLRIDLASDPTFQARFRREAQAVSDWSEAAVAACAFRQRAILDSAAVALRPGPPRQDPPVETIRVVNTKTMAPT